MDSLGITIDEDGNGCITIDELEMVAKEFVDKNPGNAENVVGIALASWLTSGDPDGTYSMNSLAYAMGAFPKTWYEKDGGIIYGSTTEEMKNALSTAAGWYRDGILDPQVSTRTWVISPRCLPTDRQVSPLAPGIFGLASEQCVCIE